MLARLLALAAVAAPALQQVHGLHIRSMAYEKAFTFAYADLPKKPVSKQQETDIIKSLEKEEQTLKKNLKTIKSFKKKNEKRLGGESEDKFLAHMKSDKDREMWKKFNAMDGENRGVFLFS